MKLRLILSASSVNQVFPVQLMSISILIFYIFTPEILNSKTSAELPKGKADPIFRKNIELI